jgi:hypothetical protein
MNRMKKIGLIALIAFTFKACAVSNETIAEESVNFSGVWEELWNKGQGMNGSIQDQYHIQHKGAELKITCPADPGYTFDHIHLTDNNFTFQLTNSNDPDDLYIVAYNLYLNQTGDLFEGTAVTNKGVEAEVEWKRISGK